MRNAIFILVFGASFHAWAGVHSRIPLTQEEREQCQRNLAALAAHAKQVAEVKPLVAQIKNTEELVIAVFRARTQDGFTEQQSKVLSDAVSETNRKKLLPFLETPRAQIVSKSLPYVHKLLENEGVPISGPSRKLARYYNPEDARFSAPPEAVVTQLKNYLAQKDWAGQAAAFERLDQIEAKDRPIWFEEMMYDLSSSLKHFKTPSGSTKQLPPETKNVADYAVQILHSVPWKARGETKPTPLETLTKAQHEALVKILTDAWEKNSMPEDEIATAVFLARQSDLNSPLEAVSKSAAEAVKAIEAKKTNSVDDIALHSPRNAQKYLALRSKPEVVALAEKLSSTAGKYLRKNPVAAEKTVEPVKVVESVKPEEVLDVAKRHALFAPEAKVQAAISPEALETASRFARYAGEVNASLLELEFATPILRRTLLSRTNALMISGPGAAKSMMSRYFLSRIVDANGKPSFFEKQLNSQTTVSDIVGIPDPVAMQKGKIKRFARRGILGYSNAFLDEVLNAGPRILTMLNEIMNERRFSESGHVFPAKTSVVFGATNKTLPQFRHEARETDDPEAILARYSAKLIIPDEVQHQANAMRLLEGSLPDGPKPIRDIDIDFLRTLIPKVTIDKTTSLATTALYWDMKRSLEAEEIKSREQVEKDRKKNPDAVAFQRTHEYSNRGLANWGKIIRAGVVDDWAVSGGERRLHIELEDLPANKFSLMMEGPSTAFLQRKIRTASNPYEKAQYEAAIIERDVFNARWRELSSTVKAKVEQTKAKIEEWKKEGTESEKGKAILAELVALSQAGSEIEQKYLEPSAEQAEDAAPNHANFDEVASYYAAVEVRHALDQTFGVAPGGN